MGSVCKRWSAESLDYSKGIKPPSQAARYRATWFGNRFRKLSFEPRPLSFEPKKLLHQTRIEPRIWHSVALECFMEVKRDTKTAGDRSEIEVMRALVQAGYGVFIPIVGENRRYDLIADDGERLAKVQVKTGRLREGAVEFNCYSSHAHRGGPACRSYVGEVDYLGIYYPQLDASYLVPIDDLAPFQSHLRIVPTRNGQRKRIRWAEAYRIRPLVGASVGGNGGSGVEGEARDLPL